MGGGGVSGGQRNAAATGLAGTAGTAAQNQQQLQGGANQAGGQATGFYSNEMQNGLPQYRAMTDYAGGDIAQSFAPARGQILRQTGQYANMPSGYRDALLNNLNAEQAQTYDSSMRQAIMANQMAKQQGAAGMQGEQQINQNAALGYGQLGAGANQAIINAPQAPSLWGTLGGLAIGGANAAANMSKAGMFG